MFSGEQRIVWWTSTVGVTWLTECCMMDRVWCTEFYMVYSVEWWTEDCLVGKRSWCYIADSVS